MNKSHRTLAGVLTGLMMLAVQTPPAAAAPLVIGAEGWTADTPAGVTYGGLVGGIAPGDGASGVLAAGVGSYTFEIQLASAAGVSTTIHFVNDGTEAVESFFRLSFKGTNTGAADWAGVNILITDVTTDPIPPEAATVDHPERAHVHRNLWAAGAFTCGDAYCGANGRYDMLLLLASPLGMGNSASGATLRLHDMNETGTAPMKFDVTFTPFVVPVPGAAILFGSALVGLVGIGRRRRCKAV